MIELVEERLSPVLEKKLRDWLRQSEADTLREVVSAQCQFHQAKALEKALGSAKGETLELISQEEMREACRYANFLAVLNSLSDRPKSEPFCIAKLKPATPHANTSRSETED